MCLYFSNWDTQVFFFFCLLCQLSMAIVTVWGISLLNTLGCKIYSWFDHLYCQCYCSCNFMLKIIIKILLKKNLFSFSPWPGTACLPRSHLSLKGILYLWSAMMKSLLYLPAWHSLLSALQSPSLSSHLIVELQQWYPVTGCS